MTYLPNLCLSVGMCCFMSVFPLSITDIDFTDPFALGIDHTTVGTLDTFVTPVPIPDVPDSSIEPCFMPHPNSDSLPSTSSNNDSLPSDSQILSYLAPVVAPNSFAAPPPS